MFSLWFSRARAVPRVVCWCLRSFEAQAQAIYVADTSFEICFLQTASSELEAWQKNVATRVALCPLLLQHTLLYCAHR